MDIQQLIPLARDLFAAKGVHFALSEVAEGAGIKVPSLYSHIDSKEDLVMAAIEKEIEDYYTWLDGVLSSLNHLPALEALEVLFYSVLGYYQQPMKVQFWRQVTLVDDREMQRKIRGLIDAKERENTRRIYALFTQGVEEGWLDKEDIEGAAYLYLAMIQGLFDILLMRLQSTFDVDRYVKITWQAYACGLGASS